MDAQVTTYPVDLSYEEIAVISMSLMEINYNLPGVLNQINNQLDLDISSSPEQIEQLKEAKQIYIMAQQHIPSILNKLVSLCDKIEKEEAGIPQIITPPFFVKPNA